MENSNRKLKIGAHVSFKKDGQLLQALKDFVAIGANSGAFYVSNSRGYAKTFPLDLENINLAKNFAKNNNINLEDIIVHSPLVGNLANTIPNSGIFENTVESYYGDLKRLSQLGIKYYNFHPGSSADKEQGIQKCAEGINELIRRTKGDETILCIETMMQKGNYIGKNFDEIARIIEKVENKDRVGVVLDTCHIWDGGYDLSQKDIILKEFDEKIGLKYLKGIHVNDSKNELGSNKDRHENIGQGYIGLEVLKNFLYDERIVNLPKAIETPYGKDDFKRWKKEIELLR